MKLILTIVAVASIACGTPTDQPAQDRTDNPSATGTTGAAFGATAVAELTDARGNAIGEATFRQTPDGVLVSLALHNAPAGAHAVHVHEIGRCDAPSFDSAGSHFAPAERLHGFLNEGGSHAGDLPNVQVPESQQVSIDFVAGGLALDAGDRSLLDADGSAIVMHAAADDYRTDPSGASGDRVACGVIASTGR